LCAREAARSYRISCAGPAGEGSCRHFEARDDDPSSELTSRELDVLRFVAVGKPNKRIAAELGASERDEQPAHGPARTAIH
jgi:DNA-binding NarL/FixJ family response regulator